MHTETQKPDPQSHIAAVLAPSGETASLRKDQLPQDALDLLAYAFANLTVGPFGMQMNAAEIQLDDPVHHILHGGGFVRHSGSDSMRYFKHAEDPDWAVVFAHDCAGDAERGLAFIENYEPA